MNRGFTLMEVLLALTLLAIVAVSLGTLSSKRLAASYQADRLLEGELLAENELNRILSDRLAAPPGRQSRLEKLGALQYRVDTSTSATESALLRRVEVVVSAVDERGDEILLTRLVGFRGLH